MHTQPRDGGVVRRVDHQLQEVVSAVGGSQHARLNVPEGMSHC